MFFAKAKLLARTGLRGYRRHGARYLADLERFIDGADRSKRKLGRVTLDIRTNDWSATHPLNKSVLEAAFAASVIRRHKPEIVYDVGSNLMMLATLSAFVDVVGLDTREIAYRQPGLSFRKMDARQLPFTDGEIAFLTSLCVIEHIGLGRYGDPIDAEGDKKFVAEVRRCLRSDGLFVMSVPVSRDNAVAFNAHRVYSLDELKSLIDGFEVSDEVFIKSGHEMLGREEGVTALRAVQENDYLVWAGCLRKVAA
jgi:SAM-dependent methyltransferase